MAPICASTLKKPSLCYPLTRLLIKCLHCINNHQLEGDWYPWHVFFTDTYPINVLLPTIIFLHMCHFSCFFVSFLSCTFLWACESLREPQKFSLFEHSLVCAITHLLLDGFQPNLVQHFPYVCSTCHAIFSLKKTLECDPPANNLHKVSVTQSILMYGSSHKILNNCKRTTIVLQFVTTVICLWSVRNSWVIQLRVSMYERYSSVTIKVAN